MTRPVHAHGYSAGDPQRGAAAPIGHVIVHDPTPKMPHPGVTPVSAPFAPAWSADGAPFYNSGYVYPQHGPLLTGGFPSLRLPPVAAMIDLTDITTWDRPVWMQGAH